MQPHANVYIRGQNWRCVQLHGLYDWQILIMSVRQRGTSLAWVKTAITIQQQATFTSRCLARDREAAKVMGMYVLLEQNGQIGQGLCVKRVSRRSSYTCSSDKLLLAISMLWKCIRGKSASVAGRKTDKYISPRSATSFCFSNNFLDPILSFGQHQARSEQTAQHQLVIGWSRSD